MALSLAELTTPVTVEETKASIYGVLEALGVNTAGWKPSGVVRTIIAAFSVVLSALSKLTANIARSGFLETAKGDWLTLVAYYVFGVERPAATFAQGLVTLVNTGGGVFDWGPGDLTVKNRAGKTFRNMHLIHLAAAPGPGSRLDNVAIIAVEIGHESTSNPGDIIDLETGALGVTVTNPTALVGLNEASDVALRTLCLEKRSSLSPNGPRDAYAYFARTATLPDGSLVGVTRVHVTKSSSVGKVTVTVGSDSGGITGDATDPTTSLGAVAKTLEENVAPDGVSLVVQSAAVGLVNVTYTAWIYSTANLTALDVQIRIADKLTAFCATQPLGGNVIGLDHGKVFVEAIRAAIMSVRPEIFNVTLSVPSGDLDMFGVPLKSPVLGALSGQVMIVEAAQVA